ncbi:hypothetical protein DdX_20758 [Ditylenchus destructor]|uniref:Uncharacterized protein n=1 Tax=Ditylenchus destructor TaxID=166010 RepID=A0AAD4QRP7_9BILA|nr:hypothetical protein DdX_20758 [Ditylenchus destructor]
MSADNRHGSKFHKKKPFRVSSSTTSSEIYQNANEEWEPMLPHAEKPSREERPLEATGRDASNDTSLAPGAAVDREIRHRT